MSNAFSDSVKDDVLFPDDLPGQGRLQLVSDGPIPAEEVPYDDAKYGLWIEVDGDRFASAPEQLREFLGNAVEEHGTTDLVFEVLEAERGPRDHDPWELEARVTHAEGTKVDD